MSDKDLTWRELKEMANSLTDEQLDDVVRWWGIERGGIVSRFWPIDEKHYYDGENWAPESTFDLPLEDNVEDINDVIEIGTPILFVD